MRQRILLAYACSGFSGLVYQVAWTRLMVLHVGHTTAAITTVVAAFMGGLALGAAVAGRLASRLTPRDALTAYSVIEIVVAAYAVILPFGLGLFTPLLVAAYRDGAAGAEFALLRTALSLIAVAVPATLLGATYPITLRALSRTGDANATGGRLYVLNTLGAACGAIAAGFLLLPSLGLFFTTLLGAAISVAAATLAWTSRTVPASTEPGTVPSETRAPALNEHSQSRHAYAAAISIVVLTGFACLLCEVVWTRAMGSLLGPTTYAFAGTVCVLISGLAIGSWAGAFIGVRTARPQFALTIVLLVTAAATWFANEALGRQVPQWLATVYAQAAGELDWPLIVRMASVFVLLLPSAIGLGMSMPIVLHFVGHDESAPTRISTLYALSSAAGVIGSLATGSLLSKFGLEGSLRIGVLAMLAASAAPVLGNARVARSRQAAAFIALAAMSTMAMRLPPQWDRELLASGMYKYARNIPTTLDVSAILKAASLLFYREGRVATVSVTEFAGKRSLAVDGKVDGSSGGDMLTQQLAAHVPLLLHENPAQVLVIGLGTGVTAAAAASHPAQHIDVIEISPEVVAASDQFLEQNRRVLIDPRVRLIVGDGRSHMALATRGYDVVISEPSNPWLAGVAALFTREAFASIRDRLAPGGIACQWVHTYDIAEDDLRSIVATFVSVFPEAMLWTIGETDMLLVSAAGSLDSHLMNIERSWSRPSAREDLLRAGVMEPFAVQSLWAGGPRTLARLGAGHALQSDDRMALEFTAPRAAFRRTGTNQASLIREMRDAEETPASIQAALDAAGALQWRNRAAMFERIGIFGAAYADYARAVDHDATDTVALSGLAVTAPAAGQQLDAADRLRRLNAKHPASTPILVAYSKLMDAIGRTDDAFKTALAAVATGSDRALALDQVAALSADSGDAAALSAVADEMDRLQPHSAKSLYYRASQRFVEGAFNQAEALAQQSIALAPRDADARNLAGAALASLQRRSEAQAMLLSALKLSPADASIYVNLGLLALEERDGPQAEKYFAGALALDPASETAVEGYRQAVSLRSR